MHRQIWMSFVLEAQCLGTNCPIMGQLSPISSQSLNSCRKYFGCTTPKVSPIHTHFGENLAQSPVFHEKTSKGIARKFSSFWSEMKFLRFIKIMKVLSLNSVTCTARFGSLLCLKHSVSSNKLSHHGTTFPHFFSVSQPLQKIFWMHNPQGVPNPHTHFGDNLAQSPVFHEKTSKGIV